MLDFNIRKERVMGGIVPRNNPRNVWKGSQSENTRTGIVAPFKDMKRNFDDMNNSNVVDGDKYFHCKANYQASKRGAYGKAVSVGLSGLKETKDVFKYGIQDSLEDWKANQDGWNGAKRGLSLNESCGHRRPSLLKDKY